jgi:hypothetical protein
MVGFDGDEISIAREHAAELEAMYARGGTGFLSARWEYEVDLRRRGKSRRPRARGTTRALVCTEAASVR